MDNGNKNIQKATARHDSQGHSPEIDNSMAFLISDVKEIINRGRQSAYSAVSQAMIETYWHIGRRIVEEEQNGEQRAEYGTQLLKQLSAALTHEFGKGFSARYLRDFRQFYLLVPSIEIWKSRFPNLTHTYNSQRNILLC